MQRLYGYLILLVLASLVVMGCTGPRKVSPDEPSVSISLTPEDTLLELLAAVTEGVGIDAVTPFEIKYLHIELTADASINVLSEFRFLKNGDRRQVTATALGTKLSVRGIEPYGFEHESAPGRPLLEKLGTMKIADMFKELENPDAIVVRLVQMSECGLLIDGLRRLESNPTVQVSQKGSQRFIPCGR